MVVLVSDVHPPTAMTQPSLPLPMSFLFPLRSPLTGVQGYSPRKNFGIVDARKRVLEHFEH